MNLLMKLILIPTFNKIHNLIYSINLKTILIGYGDKENDVFRRMKQLLKAF